MRVLWTVWMVLLGLGQFCPGPAAILRVPADYPGVQAAMDASTPGDTVHVAPGTWFGLYTSPTHGLTLCSDYLFTQDSTDINQTILDGEYQGTILDLVCENEWFILCGFTVQNGLGQQTGSWGYCDRAGAVQMNPFVSAEIRDTVFRGNRAPRAAAVLFMGTVCSAASSQANLKLINIACYDTVVEDISTGLSAAIRLRPSNGLLVIDGLYIDGGGLNTLPFDATAIEMDSLLVNNVRIVNSLGARFYFSGSVTPPHSIWITNLSSTDARGPNSCRFILAPFALGGAQVLTTIRNVKHSGLLNAKLKINTNQTIANISDVTIERCRYNDPTANTASNLIQASTRGILRNLHMHHNVNGDSTGALARTNLELNNFDVDSVWIHDNLSILPPHPSPGNSSGNWVDVAMLYALSVIDSTSDRPFEFRNLYFENNRIEDLDDYSNHSPGRAYRANYGRELGAFVTNGAIVVSKVRIRNSRQPNHCPEVYSVPDIESARPGSTLWISGIERLTVDNVLIEDSDDGGIAVVADTVLASNIVIRNVGRVAIKGTSRLFAEAYGYAHFRNVFVENVDAVDNFLPPQYQYLSNQAVFFSGLTSLYNGVPPQVVFENLTVTGCDGMRHLFNFYEPVDLEFRNCLFHNNTYEYLVSYDDPITQNWEYCFTEEPVPGSNNEVGLDPWFDEELGAPWLSTFSPAIDAGDPSPALNDIEDPDNPGFALWPSQGMLRNDIGYTGGPQLAAIDTNWVSLKQPMSRPVALAQGFTLHSAYPNPFNPSTTVSYTLARPMQVELSVYNLLGQQVRTLVFGLQDAGEHSVPFTAGELASGVYVVELQAGGHSQTQKVLLLK
jgi:hypothetical protein